MCLDVEVDGDEVPNIILTEVEEGRDTKIMIAALLPPSLSQCHHPVPRSCPTMRGSQPPIEQQQEECKQFDIGRTGGQARPHTPSLPSTPPSMVDSSEELLAAQANGSRDSHLLCYSRRRQPLQSGTPRGGSCWFSQLAERQWGPSELMRRPPFLLWAI